MGEDEHGYGRVSLWVRMGSGQGKANFSNHGVDFERAHRFSRTRWSYDSRSARRPTRAEVRATRKAMKPEYDFTKGERGKFYRPEAEMRLPIYLDADVQDYLAQRAAEKGMPLGEW